jgi:hypothetical protein
MIDRKIQMIFIFMMSFLCCVGYATDAEDIVNTLKAAWNKRGSVAFKTYLDEPWNDKDYGTGVLGHCWAKQYNGGLLYESAQNFNENFGLSGLSDNHYKSCKLLTPEVWPTCTITVEGKEGDTERWVKYFGIEAPLSSEPESDPRKWAGFWYSTAFTKVKIENVWKWKMYFSYRVYQVWNWAAECHIPNSTTPWYP